MYSQKIFDLSWLTQNTVPTGFEKYFKIKPLLEKSLKKQPTLKGTVKPVLRGHSKIDKTQILMTNGSLLKV